MLHTGACEYSHAHTPTSTRPRAILNGLLTSLSPGAKPRTVYRYPQAECLPSTPSTPHSTKQSASVFALHGVGIYPLVHPVKRRRRGIRHASSTGPEPGLSHRRETGDRAISKIVEANMKGFPCRVEGACGQSANAGPIQVAKKVWGSQSRPSLSAGRPSRDLPRGPHALLVALGQPGSCAPISGAQWGMITQRKRNRVKIFLHITHPSMT